MTSLLQKIYTEENNIKNIVNCLILTDEYTKSTTIFGNIISSQLYKDFFLKGDLSVNKSDYFLSNCLENIYKDNAFRDGLLNYRLPIEFANANISYYFSESDFTIPQSFHSNVNIAPYPLEWAFSSQWTDYSLPLIKRNKHISILLSHSNPSDIDNVRYDCQKIISKKESLLKEDVIVSLKKQLDIIINSETWDPEDQEPSIFSFSKLVSFYEHYNDLRPASITITNDGNFAATWFMTRKQLVRLDFNPNSWVSWLIFTEHHEATKQPIKEIGFNKSTDIKKILESFKVWSWMSK